MACIACLEFPCARFAATRLAGRTGSALLLAALLATFLAACGQGGPGSAAPNSAPMAVPARVMQVAPQRVPIVLEAVGQVQGAKEVEVRARVSGILLKRLYAEGELVRADAPLFQIDPAAYEIALAQARAQLAQERARSEQARREAARLKDLAGERAISQKEYDDATSTLKLSDATLQAAEANLRQAELNLSYTLVTAPVSGVAGRMLRSEGSLIAAGQDSSLLTTINQVKPIWVRFSLSESDLARLPEGKLARGGAAAVRLTLPDGSRYAEKGRINFAATQIDPRLATQELRAEFDNPRVQLLPGEFVRVQLTAGARDNVFLVPQTAVVQAEKGYFLFVLDSESKAAIRPVETGDWVGADWMILKGLNAGDRVILDNLLKLRPGAPVSPQPPANTGAAATQAAAKAAAAK
ncbi:MAG: efflux RND transporter periplasmic adaptor subunit [Burkholderiales bacterium]